MINLFHLNDHIIDTSKYSNLLHDNIVTEFEDTIKDYVGAKYAVSFNSATSAIFLALLEKNITLKVPSMIPPVVLNAIMTSGHKYTFSDDVDWVGDSYTLHDFGDYKIVDSAQKLMKNQFIEECDDDDLMVFSFYPTKPIGSCDGGMIVSNNIEKILHLKSLALNGMGYMKDNGVSTGIHYEAAHLHPTYRIDGSKCPKSEQLSKQTVSIPFHEGLKISEIYHIINKIKEYYGKTVLT